ncbi:DDE-type integrase/transposase/recombinase [Mycobacterium sp. CVI_P3]|uniref:DDE-type integrase/transposase/recombinase n=1 Tax=Mycobacterium pinniadriaticum TaxID=2994102 RepID=A0ABT3SP78_9MYCO|nr:DDE-type integrase/transposase/recombinase [Mycobacterium pinniadriaticum]MCX2934921.1 DDE-type integrase/transposase/recombinase [Mycobacterium pinniadriaticum]MCX2941343.1 DDE-type integrase/transposase/recombinase [Mycobacterium pinniadriaticum]
MGLTLAERRAVTQAAAIRYQQACKGGKTRILDELCANTGWHRSHARKALTAALAPKIVAPRSPRPVKYGEDVIAALTLCWTVLDMPAGKRLAPMLAELVAVLRHFRELVISDDTAALLVSMSAATIDRRLADERAKHTLKGRVGTKPGSLLKSQIPVRTWADWDDAAPGFLEIDTVFHDGGSRGGGHAFTLTVTDIATGWTESRSLPDRMAKHILAALNHIAAAMPFPILGVDCDNGSEFINDDLLRWCRKRKITFTRSRPGNKNDGCHVEQKNWAVVRTVVGYYRYDTASELLLLNEIWQLQSQLTNYFHPQQKLVSKVRSGAKVSRKHDKARTPFHRAINHPSMTVDRIVALKRTYSLINPAATQRQMGFPRDRGGFLMPLAAWSWIP